MQAIQSAPFDSKSFLAAVGEGRTIQRYAKNAVVLAQWDVADSGCDIE